MKAWREASSLIVLTRHGAKSQTNASKFNYDILFQKRSSKARAFPNSIVFPGGVLEESDFSDEWIDYVRSAGIPQEKLEMLKKNTSTPIFQDNSLNRHIGLRIAAIRETFEEVGVLMCNSNDTPVSNWATAYEDFDVKTWQNKVHNNSGEFLNLCKTLKCYPNMWALSYWRNWLTPPQLKYRFDTTFFIAAFNETPQVAFDRTEVAGYQWATLDGILERSNKEEIIVLGPQKYELLRISEHKDIDELVDYAVTRSKTVDEALYYPVQIQTKDGVVAILPGDDLYPKEVDYAKDYSSVREDITREELREGCVNMHRMERPKSDVENWTCVSNIKL